MFSNRNQNTMKTRECHIIDMTQAPYMAFGTGIIKNNPRRCFYCRQPICPGEDWKKFTSPKDPVHGRYSFVVHTRCLGAAN